MKKPKGMSTVLLLPLTFWMGNIDAGGSNEKRREEEDVDVPSKAPCSKQSSGRGQRHRVQNLVVPANNTASDLQENEVDAL